MPCNILNILIFVLSKDPLNNTANLIFEAKLTTYFLADDDKIFLIFRLAANTDTIFMGPISQLEWMHKDTFQS